MDTVKDKNVKISLPLLSQTISLLDCWDISMCDPAIQYDYDTVYMALLKKRQSIELRQDYANIIFAEDDEARFSARMNYLRRKREYDSF